MISGKRILTLLILTIIFISCSTNKKDTSVNSLKDLQTYLTPTPQKFEISPSKETMLKGDKGTAIYIPPDAFQFEDGTMPKGKVNIELKECYSEADMVAESMNTTSEQYILATGGMVYFNASADGKKLSIQNGKSFVIGFPKGNQTAEMDLFYDYSFNDTVSTWIPDYNMYEVEARQKAKVDTIQREEDSVLAIEYPIKMTDDLFDYKFWCVAFTSPLFDLPLVGQKHKTIIDYINDSGTIQDSIARLFYTNNWRVHYDFNIDKHGKMSNFKVDDDEDIKYNSYALKVVKKYFENAPAFNLSIDTIEIDHDWNFSIGVMAGRELNEERFKKRFRTKNPQDTKVQIIFKDINSILAGSYEQGQLVFKNVPLGRAIKVVGISYANGKPTISVAQTTIDKDGFELLDFKEFSLDNLEEELNN